MDKVIETAEKALLVLIALATLYATGEELLVLVLNRHVELADLLLLFI